MDQRPGPGRSKPQSGNRPKAPRAEGRSVSLPALPTGWEGVAPLAMVSRVALSAGYSRGSRRCLHGRDVRR